RSYCHKVRLVKPCTTVCSDGKNSASTLLTENFKSTITWSRTRSVRSLSEERITCLPDHTTGHEERPCCTLSWVLAKSMMYPLSSGSRMWLRHSRLSRSTNSSHSCKTFARCSWSGAYFHPVHQRWHTITNPLIKQARMLCSSASFFFLFS